MKIGLQVSDFTVPGGPPALAADLRRMAVAAEDAGFARLGVADHLWQIPANGSAESEMLEAYTTRGYLAAVDMAVRHVRGSAWDCPHQPLDAEGRIPMGVVHTVTELTDPEWEGMFDVDRDAANAVRARIADELAATGDLFAPRTSRACPSGGWSPSTGSASSGSRAAHDPELSKPPPGPPGRVLSGESMHVRTWAVVYSFRWHPSSETADLRVREYSLPAIGANLTEARGAEMADGAVLTLWRYPLKSMQGEELNASRFNNLGLLGDRAFALVDVETGKVVSAKNPRKWPDLFLFRAMFTEPPEPGEPLPPVTVTLPDGSRIGSEDPRFPELVSAALGRRVVLASAGEPQPTLEEYWPDMAELDHQDTVTDEAMPAGTFFDLAGVHLLTTSTIDRLRELHPRGRFEVRRFRPNIVVQVADDLVDFTENKWVGRRVEIGDEVTLEITGPCPRCVMTTLPQGDLPKDREILRTAARYNDVNVGVYAEVRQAGMVQRGDTVSLA